MAPAALEPGAEGTSTVPPETWEIGSEGE